MTIEVGESADAVTLEQAPALSGVAGRRNAMAVRDNVVVCDYNWHGLRGVIILFDKV